MQMWWKARRKLGLRSWRAGLCHAPIFTDDCSNFVVGVKDLNLDRQCARSDIAQRHCCIGIALA